MQLMSQNQNIYSNLTFIGHLEAQRATGIICFEVEPHLMTGAHDKVWSSRTRQTIKQEKPTYTL